MDKIHVIRTGVFGVNTLIVPLSQNDCFVVDPAACSLSGDKYKITSYLESKKLNCREIVLTHAHFDHITGIDTVKNCFPEAKIAIHKNDSDELRYAPGPMNSSAISFFGESSLLDAIMVQPAADILLEDGDSVFDFTVIHTPGHTPGSICLYSKERNVLISGDTLFDYGGYGRTDLQGGDEALILKSLENLRKIIPADALVYPGHDNFGFKFL